MSLRPLQAAIATMEEEEEEELAAALTIMMLLVAKSIARLVKIQWEEDVNIIIVINDKRA